MKSPDPALRDVARRLIALEAARGPVEGPAAASLRACETLRAPLARLVGTAGYRSLLSRALAMARGEVPALDAVRMLPDGSLEVPDGAGDAEAGAVVMAHLLGLLAIFVGEPLTLRIVGDIWPEASGAGNGGAS
jgi:hypothetical protein